MFLYQLYADGGELDLLGNWRSDLLTESLMYHIMSPSIIAYAGTDGLPRYISLCICSLDRY